MTTISMVMPVYNGKDYLPDTLDSVLAQSFVDWELICVDDGSTDDSLQILERYARKDPRIRVFTKPNEGSATKTTKFGVDRVDPGSQWFYYLSQDDLLSLDLLANLYNRARETQVSVVLPDMVWYYADPHQKPKSVPVDFVGYRGERDIILTGREAFLAANAGQMHGFMLVSMDIVRQVGYHDFSYNSGDASAKFWMLASEKVAFCPGTFYYRQDNSGAITQKITPMRFEVVLTNQWMVNCLQRNCPKEALLCDSAKQLQLNDLIGYSVLFFRIDNQIIANTAPHSRFKQPPCISFTESEKHHVAQMLKEAWVGYKQTGVYWEPTPKGLIKSLMVNLSYPIFKLCIHLLVCMRRRWSL
jgi:hypothetical protein